MRIDRPVKHQLLVLLLAAVLPVASCSSSEEETEDAAMENGGENAAALEEGAENAVAENAPAQSENVANVLNQGADNGMAESDAMAENIPSDQQASELTENFPANNAAAANALAQQAVPGEEAPVNAVPVNAGSEGAPVAEAAPVAMPVDSSLPQGSAVLYVTADGIAVKDKPDANGSSVKSLEQGDHFLGNVEGSYAKMNEGEFVPVEHLSVKAVPRGYRSNPWKVSGAH